MIHDCVRSYSYSVGTECDACRNEGTITVFAGIGWLSQVGSQLIDKETGMPIENIQLTSAILRASATAPDGVILVNSNGDVVSENDPSRGNVKVAYVSLAQ